MLDEQAIHVRFDLKEPAENVRLRRASRGRDAFTDDFTKRVKEVSLKEAVEAYERELIQKALKATRGNRARAALLLQTTDRVINYKIRKLRIDYKSFRG